MGSEKIIYQRQRREDYGKPWVTERDLIMLRWIGEQYAIRIDHLQELATRLSPQRAQMKGARISYRGVQALYRRWLKMGWIEKQKIFAAEPPWVWPTRKAIRELALPFPHLAPGVVRFAHIHTVNAVRLHVEQRSQQQAVWISERLVNKQRRAGRKRHLVDGEVLYKQMRIGVEVELTQKARHKLLPILRELQQDYQAVWYFAADDCLHAVKTAIATLGERRQAFVTYALSAIVDG